MKRSSVSGRKPPFPLIFFSDFQHSQSIDPEFQDTEQKGEEISDIVTKYKNLTC